MSAPGKSRVYIEVTIPSETGTPIQFVAEGEKTEELDVAALHEIMKRSEEEIIKALGLRDRR